MNKIKGLIIKDLLQLKAYKKNFILSLAIYVALIYFNRDSQDIAFIGISMITFLFSLYAISTFNYDEKTNTDKFILTMPLSRNTTVLSKYIFLIISIIVGIILGTIICYIMSVLNIINLIAVKDIVIYFMGLIFALSLMQCIQVPCIYKYGAEKGRMQIYIIMMIIFVLIGGIYYLFPKIDLGFMNKLENIIPFILMAIIILNYYLSYKISCKIYNKKDI